MLQYTPTVQYVPTGRTRYQVHTDCRLLLLLLLDPCEWHPGHEPCGPHTHSWTFPGLILGLVSRRFTARPAQMKKKNERAKQRPARPPGQAPFWALIGLD
jgi:hypothetical protein